MNVELVEIQSVAPAQKAVKEVKPDDIAWNITLDQIESNTGRIVNKRYSTVSDASQSTHFVDENNVLYSKLRPNLNKVIIPNEFAIATTELVPLHPDKTRLISKYLLYLLRSDRFVEWASMTVAGAKMPRLNMKEFWKYKIPLPPLETQKQIVELLDRAQALIDKRKEQIGLMDQLIQSLFYDMFGDPVTNPMGREVKNLGKLGDLKRGKSKHRPRNDPALLGGKYPLVQTGDIAKAGLFLSKYTQTYSDLGLAQSKLWKKGTLCITIAANIAKTSILTFDACFPDSVVAFLPTGKVDKMYIQLWFGFLQKIIEASAPESAQKNINLKILNELDVPVPSISLQHTFAQRVQKIEAQKASMTTSLKQLENNFNSLMQRAFKGELTT
jgi:type I restriction enzyme S subunit